MLEWDNKPLLSSPSLRLTNIYQGILEMRNTSAATRWQIIYEKISHRIVE